MKFIVAIIQPHQLAAVKEELTRAEVHLMTVSEVLGCGRQKGQTTVYRGKTEVGNLRRKIKLEIAVNEEFVEATVNAISQGAQTGQIGDGKIFVLDLAECYRIRTGEKGTEAIG